MQMICLPGRLEFICEFIPQDAVIADIGTDHALIPAALMLSGRVRGAYASDVAEGPLCRAANNLQKFGLDGKIELVMANGLDGFSRKGITDIIIAGMGGELIASILSRADFVRTEEQRLVLQPMTKKEALRKYLLENGFSFREHLFLDSKLYNIITARYTAEHCKYNYEDYMLGLKYMEGEAALLKGYIAAQKKKYRKIISGKERVGLPCEAERELLLILEREGERYAEN